MAAGIVHRFAVELRAMIGRMLAASGRWPMIALAIVEVMIYVTVEVSRSVKPGSGADEDAAREPFRAVVTVGSAVVRRHFIISVRTNGRRPNAHRNLRLCAITGRHEKTNTHHQHTHAFYYLHRFAFPYCETND